MSAFLCSVLSCVHDCIFWKYFVYVFQRGVTFNLKISSSWDFGVFSWKMLQADSVKLWICYGLKGLKKHFYHHTFLFFIYDDLSFINTTQQTLKPSKKKFQFPRWMKKNFIPENFSWRVSAETWDASCFKKGLLGKQQSVLNTCDILPLKNILFSELNRCVFQISLNYIKLVNFNFYFKIMWLPPVLQKIGHTLRNA